MPYSDFTKQEYSDQDFLRLVEQRIRKEIRQHHLLDAKQTYMLSETTSMNAAVLSHYLQQIFHDRLSFSTSGHEISTTYLEQFISDKLGVFLQARSPQELTAKTLAPLRSVTKHEIAEVARILQLEGSLNSVEHPLIESLQQKYPQTKPSFVKSFLHIEEFSK